MENGTSSGCRRVRFDTLCTEVCKKNEMKRSSTLSALQNDSFRKGALRFSLCFLHIVTRKYYFEVSHKQIFLHIVLSHEEKQMYADVDNPGEKLPSSKCTTKFYCVDGRCVKAGFPYFEPNLYLEFKELGY